ncbi:ppGpp synthetase [Micromonospora sp. ATCC 39149]|nr:RelA/SpoT family protein [Micromonospora sp. ATCC 39149]EEP69689.1 ppGpp synthetase [Micromonospora sp. ATCC 39149]
MGKANDLASAVEASWEELLHAATVAIEVPSPSGGAPGRGTGFLVAPATVATCAHVLADDGQPVAGTALGRVVAAGVSLTLRVVPDAVFRTRAGLDLALLAVDQSAPSAELTPVLSSPVVSVGDALWAYGHPDGMFRSGQPATFVYEGQSRRSEDDPLRLLRLRGTPVTPGFSGSPVVNRRTGAVCGMICTSSTTGSAHMLPISEILSRCAHVGPQLATVQLEHQRWLSLLTDRQLAAGRWRFPGPQLRAYLALAERTSSRHPYRMPTTTQLPPLTAVYVRQTTRLHERPTADRPAPALIRPAEVVFDGDRDAFLVGGAGAGKSSLFQVVTRDLIRRQQSTDVTDVPVRVQATDLLEAHSLGEAVARSVRADFGLAGTGGSWPSAFFDEPPMPDGAWLVLVDGLDEIMDSGRRQDVLAFLAAHRAAPASAHRFVIATRPAADLPTTMGADWEPLRFELLAFDEEQRRRFTEGWFTRLAVDRPGDTAGEFDRELDRLGLGELARNPLMATMLCQLFVANPERRLPRGRNRIFHDFVQLLRERQYSDADGGIRQQVLRRLRRYGRQAEEAGERLIVERDGLIGRLAADRLAGDPQPAVDKLAQWTRHLPPSSVPTGTWRDLLADLLRRSGVLLERGDDFVSHRPSGVPGRAGRRPTTPNGPTPRSRDLFLRTVSGRAVAPPAWRQSFARFLVAAWPQPDAVASALRAMTATGGLGAAIFVSALVDDGHDLTVEIIDNAVRALRITAHDDRVPVDDRQMAVDTCVHLSRPAGLDLARAVVTNPKIDRRLRIGTLRTLADLAPHPTAPRPMDPDGAVSDGGDKWIMEQLARLVDVDGRALLATVSQDAAFEGGQRVWAADALARAGDERGPELLVRLARHPALNPLERRVAVTALQHLGGTETSSLPRDLAPDEAMPGAARASMAVPHRRSSVRRLARRIGIEGFLGGSPQVSEALEPVVACHRQSHPSADVLLLQRAFDTASWWHSGQYRKSGDPYITHPLAVATILANLGMDTTTLVAGLLSGTVEDAAYPLQQLHAEFGPEVAALVDGVTKLDRVRFGDAAEAESIRKMVVAMAKDPRVLVIKLADRLHNMRTLSFLPRPKQEQKATETLEILAPLAHRLGMNAMKWELEDLAFNTLFPKRCEEIFRLVEARQPQREALLRQVTQKMDADLKAARIKAETTGQPKHLYSIYQKMIVRGRDFADIYDLVGVRILVDTVRDCYAALGVVHANWPPVPGRIKDYVAMPKFNMYQSLHTTVVGPTGQHLEVQIRTHAMHRTAEYGITAHWKYGAQAGGTPAHIDEMTWLRLLLDWQREAADPSEFLDALRFDLSSQEVYVFTPKGDVIPLPTGSTPVDFAYGVHTEVGHRCIGARVNGKLVPLEAKLSNGDVVEIFTSKSETAGPSQDWLGFVKSPRARTKIRQFFSGEGREEAIEAGKGVLVKAMRRQGIPLQRMLTSDALLAIARDLHLADVASLYAAVGDHRLSAQSVVQQLIAAYGGEEGAAEDMAETAVATRPPRIRMNGHDTGVVAQGAGDKWTKLARCCTPVPPDSVFGFATKGGWVSVHRDDCANAEDLRAQSERVVEVSWSPTAASAFLVAIQVEALDRHRLLADVTRVLSDERVNILSATVTTTRDRVAVSRFSFEMADPKHLGHLLAAVRKVEGVFDAYRVTSGA